MTTLCFNLFSLDFSSNIGSVSGILIYTYKNYPQYCQSGDFQINPVNHPNPTDLEAARWWTQNAVIVTKCRIRSERRMNMTVSGTDDPGQRHVSQIATSSSTQHDVCPVTTSNQRITYTTAQLHEMFIGTCAPLKKEHLHTVNIKKSWNYKSCRKYL